MLIEGSRAARKPVFLGKDEEEAHEKSCNCTGSGFMTGMDGNNSLVIKLLGY